MYLCIVIQNILKQNNYVPAKIIKKIAVKLKNRNWDMVKDLVLVGIGSGIGGMCRYLISLLMGSTSNGFPWGTFTVNIAGCLLIGLLWGMTSRFSSLSPALSLLLMVGFCGGFTTFSTFSKESLLLLQSGNYLGLSCYIAGSVVIGILAVWLGFSLMK